MSRSVVNYDRSGNSKVNRASENTTTGEISSLNMDESESAVSESTHGRSSQHFHTICSHLSLRVDWRESLLSTVRDRRFSGNRILHRLAMVLLVLDPKMPFDSACPTSLFVNSMQSTKLTNSSRRSVQIEHSPWHVLPFEMVLVFDFTDRNLWIPLYLHIYAYSSWWDMER